MQSININCAKRGIPQLTEVTACLQRYIKCYKRNANFFAFSPHNLKIALPTSCILEVIFSLRMSALQSLDFTKVIITWLFFFNQATSGGWQKRLLEFQYSDKILCALVLSPEKNWFSSASDKGFQSFGIFLSFWEIEVVWVKGINSPI